MTLYIIARGWFRAQPWYVKAAILASAGSCAALGVLLGLDLATLLMPR